MPKPKPDQVIRHELALSRPMQISVDQYVTAHSFQAIATPVVDLMKDVSGMIVFLSVVAAIGYNFDFIATGATTIDEALTMFKEQRAAAQLQPGFQEAYQERASSVTGGLLNVFSQIFDSLSGTSIERSEFFNQER